MCCGSNNQETGVAPCSMYFNMQKLPPNGFKLNLPITFCDVEALMDRHFMFFMGWRLRFGWKGSPLSCAPIWLGWRCCYLNYPNNKRIWWPFWEWSFKLAESLGCCNTHKHCSGAVWQQTLLVMLRTQNQGSRTNKERPRGFQMK